MRGEVEVLASTTRHTARDIFEVIGEGHAAVACRGRFPVINEVARVGCCVAFCELVTNIFLRTLTRVVYIWICDRKPACSIVAVIMLVGFVLASITMHAQQSTSNQDQYCQQTVFVLHSLLLSLLFQSILFPRSLRVERCEVAPRGFGPVLGHEIALDVLYNCM